MSVRSEILAEIIQVAEDHNRSVAPLDDDLPLMASGLDSLCLAVIIARLEDKLGVDPFSSNSGEEIPFPVTVGELIDLYERVAQ